MRLLIGVGGVAFAVLLVFINLGFLGSLNETAGVLYNQMDADIFLISPLSTNGTSTKIFDRERLYQAQSYADVESAVPLYIGYLSWRDLATTEQNLILCLGFNPAENPWLLPELGEPANQAGLAAVDSVLFDVRSQPKYGKAEVGLEAEANNRQVKIGGLYSLGGGLAADGTLLVSDQNFVRIMRSRPLDQIDLGLIKLKPNSDINQAIADLRAMLPEDVSLYTKSALVERERQYWLKTTAVGFIFRLGTGIALIVGASIVYQILYADVTKNFKEYATLKAIGFRNQFVMGVVVQESLLLAIVGFVPGLVSSWALYQFVLLSSNGAIPMKMSLAQIFQVAILTAGMCLVSGLIAMRKVLAADPADVF
ncbi:MAG: FtsX-like permease family protein [Phormidesmis sp. RL_2_1]|nr:FtsX-like permease family protein [Phormidesmis sp. RL_2_1]